MRRKPVSLIGLLQAAAFITVASSFVTSMPSLPHYVELFSHFRLQYLVVCLMLLVVFAALRNTLYSVALFVALVLNAGYVVPWYMGDSIPESAEAIKLIHVNVRAQNEQHERLFELIQAEQPDIFFVQEVSPAWFAAMQPLKTDYPFSYAEPRHGNFGIAMFSRLPLDSVTHVDSPPLQYPTMIATLSVAGEPLTLINTHPTIPLTRSGFEARNEHLQSVSEIVKSTGGAIVLSGDFNTSMWSPTYRSFEASTGLSNTRRGVGVLPTWPTFMPFAMIPIDHALVSHEVRVHETRRGMGVGSDHRPLIIRFTL
ncbi:MAG: endonuclease/exonuclease/phosphatase family protein [Woeseiaceae bacterium]